MSSEKTFWLIVGLFLFEALWLAFSGRYPMAFDEDFHLGIIKIYAYHLSPFWGSQPVINDTFGAVNRDPSFLYQYIMSFPYRFIQLFTKDQTIIVIFLRIINVALFALSLPIFRRLLQKTGASKQIIHAALLLFILIPVVPLLAAQINYDNLFIPLSALTILLTINFTDQFKAHKPISFNYLLGILSLFL